MRFRTLAAFDRDYAQLTPEHRKAFRAVLHKHFLPAVTAGAFTGRQPWPTRLRLHKLSNSAIYSLTWSFAGPDGRATFHLENDAEGTTLLVWRRIGTHAIYHHP